jgi:hypothetical protein
MEHERIIPVVAAPAWARALRRPASRVLLALLVAVAVSFALVVASSLWRGEMARSDFLVFYSAGRTVLAGAGDRVYDEATLLVAERDALAGIQDVGQPMPFLNPPPAALLLAPLALLPYPVAVLVWAGLQLGLLVWAVRLALQAARDWSSEERRLLVAATLAFPPLLITFVLGTFSLLLLVCLWQVYHDLRAGRHWRAGAWLALSLVKPQAWVLVVVLLLAARQWRTLGSAVAVGAGLVTATSAIMGWQIWTAWPLQLAQYSHQGGEAASMYTLKGTLSLLLGGTAAGPIEAATWGALLIAVGATAWLWRGRWQPAAPAFDARFAFTVMLGLLVSPHLHPHDSLLLAVPATLAYGLTRQPATRQPLVGALLAVSPLLFLLGDHAIGVRLGMQVQVALMLGLAGWLAWAIVKQSGGHGLEAGSRQQAVGGRR